MSDIFKFTSRNKENSQKISDDTYKVIEKNKNIYNYKKIKELENQIETLTFSKENLEKVWCFLLNISSFHGLFKY